MVTHLVFTKGVVAAVLMKELATASCQLTGSIAFQRHDLSSHLSLRIDLYNDKLSGVKTILGQEFRFIKVEKDRLQNAIKFMVSEREGDYLMRMGSLARTIFDAIYDYDRFAMLEDAFEWLEERIGNGVFMREFTELLVMLGNVGVQRRAGFIMDETKGGSQWAMKIQLNLPTAKGLIPLFPTKGQPGIVDKKWGVIVSEK